MLLEGQGQADGRFSLSESGGSHQTSLTHSKATHRAVQLNSGDLFNSAQSGPLQGGGHSMVKAAFVNPVGPKDREGSGVSQHSSIRS